jgi:glycosyltransferase involved in cell wall biosynthesis
MRGDNSSRNEGDSMKPKVSVITPAYNRKDLTPRTVASVLDQSLADIEYLVVDDGSEDGTREWLAEHSDSRLRLLVHPGNANRGQAASINLGLAEARGDYIVIIDSDDLLAPGALEYHARIMDADASVGVVYGQGYAIDIDDKELYPLFDKDHAEYSDPDRLLLDCYVVSPGLCLFRRSVVEQAGALEETFRAAQDHDFLLRVAEKNRMVYSGYTCFFYRKHDATISANGEMMRWQNGFEILRRAAARFPYKSATIRRRRAVLNYRLGMVYLKQQRCLKALRYLLVAGVSDPARAIGVLVGREAAG